MEKEYLAKHLMIEIINSSYLNDAELMEDFLTNRAQRSYDNARISYSSSYLAGIPIRIHGYFSKSQQRTQSKFTLDKKIFSSRRC